jgi:hypothetical protein
MSKNYCKRFTDDVFKRYDLQNKGLIKSNYLKN